MSTVIRRFETLNDLYYRATGYLRPGKSVPPGCGYDSSSEENQVRFENWLATRAFTDAVDRVAELEHGLDVLIARLEEAGEHGLDVLIARLEEAGLGPT